MVKPKLPLGLPPGNTVVGKRLRDFHATLVRHIGNPTITQSALIDRAVMLQLHITNLDLKASMSGNTMREYLGWSNSLVRVLARLGLAGVARGAPDIHAVIATRHPKLTNMGEHAARPGVLKIK
jgi:hypothetical protein